MGCKSKRTFWMQAGGRLSFIPEGAFLPGQDRPVQAGFGGLKSGQLITVDCRVCPSCIVKYQNALIGSCLAETAYAHRSVAITMTYGNDPGSDTRADLAHRMLTKPHIREMTQRLLKNRALGRFRYLFAGEYGPLHGRAHWHGVLIFEDDKMPAFDFDALRYNDNRLWPYGFVQARPIDDEAAFRYVCKYAVKSTKAMRDHSGYMPGVETVLMRSRIPPLGQPFFIERAVQQADFGVPLSMRYMPPGGLEKANYHVRGLSNRLAMAHAYLGRLDEAGHDVTYYADRPRSYRATGRLIPLTPDRDIARLLETACRERRLAALPEVTVQQDVADLVAEMAERQAVQARLNRLQEKRQLAADLRRSKERLRRLDDDRRADAERFARKSKSGPSPVLLGPSDSLDPSDLLDPFASDHPMWDDFSVGRYSVDLVRSGAWRDD